MRIDRLDDWSNCFGGILPISTNSLVLNQCNNNARISSSSTDIDSDSDSIFSADSDKVILSHTIIVSYNPTPSTRVQLLLQKFTLLPTKSKSFYKNTLYFLPKATRTGQ